MQNNCGPSNIFGGIQQHLFLGLTLTGFSANAGWSDQVSELKVVLIDDNCPNPSGKVYYDQNLDRKVMIAADPGFLGDNDEIIGCPAFFRYGDGTTDFEFTGIIQNWNKDEKTNEYTVTLTDPRQILEGCQIILSDYAGPVNTYNMFNVYGEMEYLAGTNCSYVVESGGSPFGSPAGKFGGSDLNDRGMPYDRIGFGLSMATSALPIRNNPFSPFGRIIFRGAKFSISNYGLIKADRFDPAIPTAFENHTGYLCDYLLDMSDIPIPPPTWRLQGPSVNIMQFISQICDDMGCDFYIELMPAKMGSQILKIIKVRTVRRTLQPRLGAISQYINQTVNTAEKNIGKELRNEPTTEFLLGGAVHTIYEAQKDHNPEGGGIAKNSDTNTGPDNKGGKFPLNLWSISDGDNDHTPMTITFSPDDVISDDINPEVDDTIIPFFGLDKFKNSIVPEKDKYGNWFFVTEIDNLNALLFNAMHIDQVCITEAELLRVHEYGFIAWAAFALGRGTETDLGMGFKSIYGESFAVFDIPANPNNIKLAADLVALGKLDALIDRVDLNQAPKDLEIIFKWLQQFAEKMGTQWMVRVPFTCVAIDSETAVPGIPQLGITRYSEGPTNDGGWSDADQILDLPHPTFTQFFAQKDNRIGCFLQFGNPGIVDLKQCDENNVLFVDGSIYVRGSVSEELVFHNYATRSIPRIVVNRDQLIRTKAQLSDIADAAKPFADGNAANHDLQTQIIEFRKNVGGQILNAGRELLHLDPSAIAIPMKSNVLRYGPWVHAGPAGSVKFDIDEQLVPWEFGSLLGLQTAALAKSLENITQMQVGENGSIEVPGYPTNPLGAEIGAVGQGFLNGLLLIENRNVVLNQRTLNGQNNLFGSLPAAPWTGLYGPNITGISVSFGQDGIKTTYTFRTFTSKIGKLERKNYERLKLLGQQTAKIQNFIKNRQNIAGRIAAGRDNSSYYSQLISSRNNISAHNINLQHGNPKHKQSPHGLLIGQVLYDEDLDINYTMVLDYEFKEALSELDNKYDEKSIMSLEGLLRPVSIEGAGGNLAPFAVPDFTGITDQNANQAAAPEPPLKEYDPIVVNQDYLNPFTNPTDTVHGDQNGHDINWVARGDEVPSTLNVRLAEADDGEGDGYMSDYRFLALRGPLVIQGWGYDLQGKPIPNKADQDLDNLDSASIGDFTEVNLQDTFPDNWLKKPYAWPVAPVDLRFDRKRGVWTVPPAYRIVLAKLDEDLHAFGNADATIQNGPPIYDDSGNEIDKTINVNDVVGNPLKLHDNVLAYYDTAESQYYVIECMSSGVAGSGTGGSGVYVDQRNCYTDDTDFSNIQAQRLVFGDGFYTGSTPAVGEDPAMAFIDSYTRIYKDTEVGHDTIDLLPSSHADINNFIIGRGLGAVRTGDLPNDSAGAPGCSGILLYSKLRFYKFNCYDSTMTSGNPGVEKIQLYEGFKVEADNAADGVKLSSKLEVETSNLVATDTFTNHYVNGLVFGKGLKISDYPGVLNNTDYGCVGSLISLSNVDKCWIGTNCDDSSDTFKTKIDLSSYDGKTVKIAGKCYGITSTTKCDDAKLAVPSISTTYPDCNSCNTCWKLVNCNDSGDITITATDLSAYNGEVIKIGSSTCYQVSKAPNCAGAIAVTISEFYPDCVKCAGVCWNIQSCADSSITTKVKNDMTSYVGQAFKIAASDGCWRVTGLAANCIGASFVDITDNYPDGCDDPACTCYKGENCEDSGDTFITNQDLSSYVGKVVKVSDNCYMITIIECAGSVDTISIQANYDTCEDCGLCWNLQNCEDSGDTIKTYIDLSSVSGKILLIDSKCYQVMDSTADCSGSVSIDYTTYDDCSTCLQTAIYVCSPVDPGSCLNGCCDDSGSPGDDAPNIFCTHTDLSAAVGQYIKFGGICYTVERNDDATCDGFTDVNPYDGPFDHCQDCGQFVQTTKIRFVTSVKWTGTALQVNYNTMCVPVTYVCDGGSDTIPFTSCD